MKNLNCKVTLAELQDSDFVTIYEWKVANPGLITSNPVATLEVSSVVLGATTLAGVQSLTNLLVKIGFPVSEPAPI